MKQFTSILVIFFSICLVSFAAGPNGQGNTLVAGLAADSPKGQVTIGDPTIMIRFIIASPVDCKISRIEAKIVGMGTTVDIVNDVFFCRVEDPNQITAYKDTKVNSLTSYSTNFNFASQNLMSLMAGGTFPAQSGTMQIVINKITAFDSKGKQMIVEGLPLFGNIINCGNPQIVSNITLKIPPYSKIRMETSADLEMTAVKFVWWGLKWRIPILERNAHEQILYNIFSSKADSFTLELKGTGLINVHVNGKFYDACLVTRGGTLWLPKLPPMP